jgi:hypothetical protein
MALKRKKLIVNSRRRKGNLVIVGKKKMISNQLSKIGKEKVMSIDSRN